MGQNEHRQPNLNRIPVAAAAAAAALHSRAANQTPPELRAAAAAAAAAVVLTEQGCLATAVDLADQRLVQTACECVVHQRKKKAQRHGDWHELAVEWPVRASGSETQASFATLSWQI